MSEFERTGLITAMRPALGGWKFPQPFDGGNVMLSGHNAEDLLRVVREFRIEQALPTGDPVADITAYITAKSPLNNGRRRSLRPEYPDPNQVYEIVPLIEHMKPWLVGMSRNDHLKLVREDEAIKRSLICLNCPLNIKWRTSCDSCNADVDYRSNNLRQRTEFRFDKRLHGCRCYRTPLQAFVFIDRDNLPPRQQSCPAECWVGRELGE